MRFRSILFLGAALLVVGIVASTVGAVATVLERAARGEMVQHLRRGQDLYRRLQADREALIRSQVQLVGKHPEVEDAMAAPDPRGAAQDAVLARLRGPLGIDVLTLADRRGAVLGESSRSAAAGARLAASALVARTRNPRDHAASDAANQDDGSAEEAYGVWLDGRRVYRVAARRFAFGAATATVAAGLELDNRLAETFARQSGTSMVIELDGRAIARSNLAGGAPDDARALAAALAPVMSGDRTPTEVAILGTRYLALALPISGYTGDAELRFVVLRSLDDALAPARELARVLYGIAAAGLVLGLALAAGFARTLSRPVDDLVAFTRAVAAGRLDRQIRAHGPIEMKTLGDAMNRMAEELAESRRQMELKERLEREMEIAVRIQTSILPPVIETRGLEAAARMLPASQVGGDYYDVIPVDDGCWIGIGDVSGNGLNAGLVMMMVQSAVAALVRRDPDASPRDLVCVLNDILYENIHNRLSNDEHVTLSLLRYHSDGRVIFAGAHEEVVVYRAATRRTSRYETPGTWLGARRNIALATTESAIKLDPRDVMVLYTDGLTEAMGAGRRPFGLDRLCEEIELLGEKSVEDIRDHVFMAVRDWTAEPLDDVTLLVLRQRGA